MAERHARNRWNRLSKQGDLFGAMFPARRPIAGRASGDLSLRIKTAMHQALMECQDSADVIALRMTEITGRQVTASTLYAYTAASKPEHDMGIARFVAFVRATGASWLWDELLADDGLTVLEGEEAQLAEVGHLRRQKQLVEAALKEAEKGLKHVPVKRRRGAQ